MTVDLCAAMVTARLEMDQFLLEQVIRVAVIDAQMCGI